MEAPQLVVIGTPSVDRIEIGGKSLDTVGGSGFITAMAARLTGVSTGLIARVPSTLPPAIAAAFTPAGIDPGGLVVVDGSLPGFHISYDADESAEYLMIEPGNEVDLRASDVPRRWLSAPWIHIGPLAASAALQIRFAESLRSRGFDGGLSAGTFSRAADGEPANVRRLFALVDIAFMNSEEASKIYPDGPPDDRIVCVTEGRDGARRWDGSMWTHHPTLARTSVDPTGAGDAFIGGYLGAMLSGDPQPTAKALDIAGDIVLGPGAAPLIDRLPDDVKVHPDASPATTSIAAVDTDRVARVGAVLRRAAVGSALSFCGMPFPDEDAPTAIDVLTVGTLHQYGFWDDTDHGYGGPMWATIDGIRRKGSDFIWHAFTRAAADDPTVLDPERLMREPLLFDEICIDDDGICPIPDAGSHRALQQAYGHVVIRLGGIQAVVDRANASTDPLATLLEALAGVPGFGEDPLAKKANLLALILANRPEHFLDLRGQTTIDPIVDYHIMRTVLRTGCVVISDHDILDRLESRAWVDAVTEAGIRNTAKDAIEELCRASGLGVGNVDGFLFALGRSICVETEPPKCDECPLSNVCARRIDLFQPIYRTTAY